MSLKAKFWWTAAAASVIVNGGGAVYALRLGEWMHGGAHVAALAITILLIAVFRPHGRRTTAESLGAADDDLAPMSSGATRMEQLQQSVDAIAVEVERIGEAQRYNAKLQAKQGETSSERR
jgi:hypothetical protein